MERIKIIGELDLKREQDRRIYEPSGLAPTLRAENHDVKILVGIIQNMDGYSYDDKTRQDKTRQDKTRQDKYSHCSSSCQVSEVKRLGNLYGENRGTGFAGNVWDKNNLCPTITTMQGGGREPMIIDDVEEAKKYRIRKLTPRECWRLMAFSDEDFDKAEKVVSNTQLYKQAGNSICVCVLMAIFSQMNIKGVKPWNRRN
jgi:site-specific DNA-cytosine methylase